MYPSFDLNLVVDKNFWQEISDAATPISVKIGKIVNNLYLVPREGLMYHFLAPAGPA